MASEVGSITPSAERVDTVVRAGTMVSGGTGADPVVRLAVRTRGGWVAPAATDVPDWEDSAMAKAAAALTAPPAAARPTKLRRDSRADEPVGDAEWAWALAAGSTGESDGCSSLGLVTGLRREPVAGGRTGRRMKPCPGRG